MSLHRSRPCPGTPLALCALLSLLLVGLTGCPGSLENPEEFDRGMTTAPADTHDDDLAGDTAEPGDTSPGDTTVTDTATTDTADPDGGGDTTLPPGCDLATLQEDIFVPKCGNDMVCHGSFAANGVNLVDPGLEARIFGATSQCNGLPLAVPGDPEGSFFWQKLVEVDPACGSQMPIGVDLTDDELACVRAWIEAQP